MKTSRLSKIALALSIISWLFVFFFITGLEIVGIILGFVSLKKSDKAEQRTRRVAIAAIIIGFLKPFSYIAFLLLRLTTQIAH